MPPRHRHSSFYVVFPYQPEIFFNMTRIWDDTLYVMKQIVKYMYQKVKNFKNKIFLNLYKNT